MLDQRRLNQIFSFGEAFCKLQGDVRKLTNQLIDFEFHSPDQDDEALFSEIMRLRNFFF